MKNLLDQDNLYPMNNHALEKLEITARFTF
jgi:hypothetical protein